MGGRGGDNLPLPLWGVWKVVRWGGGGFDNLPLPLWGIWKVLGRGELGGRSGILESYGRARMSRWRDLVNHRDATRCFCRILRIDAATQFCRVRRGNLWVGRCAERFSPLGQKASRCDAAKQRRGA